MSTITVAFQSPPHPWPGLKPAHAMDTAFTRITLVNISRLCVQGAAPAREAHRFNRQEAATAKIVTGAIA